MTTLDALRATAHPLRLRLLSLVTSTAMSAAEAGRELGMSQAAASYHLRVLERAGLVRVVEVATLLGCAAVIVLTTGAAASTRSVREVGVVVPPGVGSG